MNRRSPLVVSHICFLAFSGAMLGRTETMAAVYPPRVAAEIEEEAEKERALEKEMLLRCYDHAKGAVHEFREPPPAFYRPRKHRDIHRAKLPKYSNQKRYVF